MFLIPVFAIAFLIGQFVPRLLQPLIFRIKKITKQRRCKPFDCEACLSFWAALIGSTFFTNIVFALLISTAVFYFTVWIEKLKIENEL